MYHTEIHVKGKINLNWSDWFGELEVQSTNGDETILLGELQDMSAVYGVISRLGSLVISLISVVCVEVACGKSREGVDSSSSAVGWKAV